MKVQCGTCDTLPQMKKYYLIHKSYCLYSKPFIINNENKNWIDRVTVVLLQFMTEKLLAAKLALCIFRSFAASACRNQYPSLGKLGVFGLIENSNNGRGRKLFTQITIYLVGNLKSNKIFWLLISHRVRHVTLFIFQKYATRY